MKRVTWTLFAIIVCAFSQAYAQSQTPKITKIKLEDYGWEPVPVRAQKFGHTFQPNLQFDHEGRVLVGFTVRESDALATREHPGRSFRILRFTSEGKPDLSLTLPTNDWNENEFYLGADDEILVRANNTLWWLSDDGSHGESQSWQPVAPCPEHCSIRQSYSRRTLILRVEPLVRVAELSTYAIIDAASSPPHVVRTCSQMASMNITDHFAYVTSYDRDDHLTVRFPFCKVDHYDEVPTWGRGGGYVLNDETLLKVSTTAASLLGADGHVKFSKETPKGDWISPGKIVTDERNERFAFMVNTERGVHPHIDVSGHLVARRVLVLDQAGKDVASIPTDTRYHIDSNFSLSPDGHRVAILDEGAVTVVGLE
jgi:hypothetical protein